MPAASSAAPPKHSSRERAASLSQGCACANRKGWAGGKQQGWAEAVFLSCAHHWPLGTEGSGGHVCFRSKLQASGCAGAQETPLLQSQEDLGTFLEPQHQGGQPSSVVWTDTFPGSPSPSCPLPFQPSLCASSVLPAARSPCAQASLHLTDSESLVCTPLSAPCVCMPSTQLLVACLCLFALRLSVPSLLGLGLCVDVGISIPLSLKGPCSPNG